MVHDVDGRALFPKRDAGRRNALVRAAETSDSELRRLLTRETSWARLITRIPVAPNLVIFRFTKPRGFSFLAGQYARLELAGERRSFSIASAPSDDVLDFFVERMEGGTFTPRLFALEEGDGISIVGKAKGGLTLADGFDHHLMIATVTGIAPFRSILRSVARVNGLDPARFVVLHGASLVSELGFREELARLPITYVPAVSRPSEPENAGFEGAVGRLDAVAASYLASHPLEAARTMVYACGHAAMVRTIERDFTARGYAVRVERFS